MNLQRNREMRILDGESKPKAARFVKTKSAQKVFDEHRFDKAVRLAGWKGYVNNIEAKGMAAREVAGSYHDLGMPSSLSGCQRPAFEPVRTFTATGTDRGALDGRVHGIGSRKVHARGDWVVVEVGHHHAAAATTVPGRD